MSKTLNRNKPSSVFVSNILSFIAGASVAFLLFWTFYSSIIPSNPNPTILSSSEEPSDFTLGINLGHDSSASTFYDDPNLSYEIEKPIQNWDEKRKTWLNHHPSFSSEVKDRLLLVTGSQAKPCKNPIGDSLLLRFFKNKVDYCRIHGIDIFYNNALLHPKMNGCWAKLPLVRSAMIAHPEVEWIWWVDSDAAFTDMEFKIPLERYENYNLIFHGKDVEVFEKKRWVGLNAGIFIMRNCQWSLDFMEVWSNMSQISPDYDNWGKILKSKLKDKVWEESDDQSSLVYLMINERKKWTDKIYLENNYYFQGYFLDVIDRFDNMTKIYEEIESGVEKLRRRHGEKVSEYYSGVRESYIKGLGNGEGSWRKPFITHFAGCQPCSGNFNTTYSADDCWKGMEKALNFADNQVLRNFGFVRRDLFNHSSLEPLSFDVPSG